MSPITFITLALATFAAALPATEIRPGGPFGGHPSSSMVPKPGPPFPFPTKLPGPPRPGFPSPSPSKPVFTSQPSTSAPASSLVCDSSAASLTVPSGLPAPSGIPTFVMLGVGTQNYTCNSAGTYTSAGALAQLFDISCLASKDQTTFDNIQDIVFTSGVGSSGVGAKLGMHFFQNVTNVLSPVWDMRGDAAKGNPNAFVLASKVANVTASTGASDVPWLFLQKVSGDLADSVYRTHTKGGQSPTSCTPGSAPITVPYTAKYWTYGGTVTL